MPFFLYFRIVSLHRGSNSTYMKYLIVSDLHGSLPALEAVLECFDREGCDMLLLLGDVLNYGPRNHLPEGLDPQAVAQRLNERASQIVAVRGNCESEVDQMLLDFPVMADYAWVVDEGRRLFLTHGHLYNDARLPKGGFDFLFYGHTHLPHITPLIEGGTLVNTGSPTFPKGGNPATFAIYEKGRVSLRLLDGSEWKSWCGE